MADNTCLPVGWLNIVPSQPSKSAVLCEAKKSPFLIMKMETRTGRHTQSVR